MTEVRADDPTAATVPTQQVASPMSLVERDVARALVATLPDRGLDRMTSGRIESVLCTSALTAHL